jgi:APA family basic amino acid/polyamine antiporter
MLPLSSKTHTAGDRSERLVRGLGPWAATAIVVGTMVGTGIFIVPADMARSANSVGLVMLAWVAGGALSLRFAGFFFPVMGTPLMIWHLPAALTGQPYAFTLTWAQPLAVAAIAALTSINYLGVRVGGQIQVALTIVKIVSVLAVIAVGFLFGHGTAANFHPVAAAPADAATLPGFLIAMVAALWAYDGWVNVTFVGSEVQNPERNMQRSLLGGVLLVCGMYVAMSLACFFVLPFSEVAASPLAASDVVARALGPAAATWLTVAMIVCVLGTLNSSILTNARVDYAMARDGLFFRVVRGVHPKFRTPGRALVFQGILASLLALTGTFEDLYSLFIFAAWIFYGLQTAAVIRLRYKEPRLPRPYRTWGYPAVPILFIAGALALTINLWLQRPLRSSMGLALIFAGLFFYAHWRRRVPENPHQ